MDPANNIAFSAGEEKSVATIRVFMQKNYKDLSVCQRSRVENHYEFSHSRKPMTQIQLQTEIKGATKRKPHNNPNIDMTPMVDLGFLLITFFIFTAAVLQNAYPSLNIITESRLGDVNDELNEVCKTMDAFAIVTGKHGASGLERFLFGSTSLSIVRHTTIPVIVIPDTSVKKEISNVALAIDDLKEELPQQQKIKTFIETLGAQLHIIHVQGNKTSSKELNNLVSFLHSKCETIHSDEFFTGIQSYLNNKNIDMLITIPHKHSFVERLTFRTHTEELLKKLTIPIACISED